MSQPGRTADSRLGAGVVGDLLDDLAVDLVPQDLLLRAQLGDGHGLLRGWGRPRVPPPAQVTSRTHRPGEGGGFTLRMVQTASSSVCPRRGWSPMNFITAGDDKATW